MEEIDFFTSSYDYNLPKSQIALNLASPPDSAKLLVYNRSKDSITHTTFREILNFLPKDLEVFINDTKVIKARIFGKKESGGKIELLLNKPLWNNTFEALIRGKVKKGTKLYFEASLEAKVLELLEDGSRIVEFYLANEVLGFSDLVKILSKIGHTPLPPYIEREDTVEDEKNYQSVFAKKEGAVAAPTASLHFTKELFEKFKKNYPVHTLTLHIGAGTFKGVDSEDIRDFQIHSEYFEIPENSAKILDTQKKILAIGTTVTRTIEYYARTKKTKGECNLFLHPANPPKRVNYLLTNFHLPKSTLIMLVSSFIGRKKTLDLYKEAIKKDYKFFSYGDAMLII
jgi:S-adenosylmethionine:tRNA ribosyltransferase-isomerase